jgi:integrase
MKPNRIPTGQGSRTVEPLRRKRDIAKIKQALKDRPRDLALFTLGINVGLRGSDLLSLRFSDVLDADDRVRRRLSITERKTHKQRHISLGPSPQAAIKSLLPEDMDELDPDAYLFPSRKGGGAMGVVRLHQLVNQWCRDAGIKGHFGSHSLRKTYGRFLYKKGTDLSLLMKVFNHSSQAITLRYIGVEQDQVDEANVRLNL